MAEKSGTVCPFRSSDTKKVQCDTNCQLFINDYSMQTCAFTHSAHFLSEIKDFVSVE